MPDKSRLNFTPITGFKKMIKCNGCGKRIQVTAYERYCGGCKRRYIKTMQQQRS